MAKYEAEGVNTSVLQVWIAGCNFDDSLLRRLNRGGSASYPVKKLRVLESKSDTHIQLTPLGAWNYSGMSCPQVNPSYPRRGTRYADRNQFW